MISLLSTTSVHKGRILGRFLTYSQQILKRFSKDSQQILNRFSTDSQQILVDVIALHLLRKHQYLACIRDCQVQRL